MAPRAPAGPKETRRLLVIPFETEGLPEGLRYMQNGLAQSLAAHLRSFGHIVVKHRQPHLRPQPRGGGPGPGLPAYLQRAALFTRVVVWDRNTYRAGKLYDDRERAHLLDADLLVSGTLNLQTESGTPDVRLGTAFTLSLRCYDAGSGQSQTVILKLRERTALRELQPAALEIIRFASVLPPAPVVLESEPDNALVFADNRYLGRSPLRAHLVPGRYRLEFRADGYDGLFRDLVLPVGGAEQKVAVRLEKRIGRAGLKVISDPVGAEVYLDAEALGKAPLVRTDLQAGPHRLRVAREGMVDRVVGVELKNGEMREVHLALRVGNTATSFANARRAFLDWTWYDLHFYSLLSGLGAYGAYVYYQSEEDRGEERARGKAPLLLPYFSQLSTPSSASTDLLVYQYYVLQNNSQRAARMRRAQSVSLSVGVTSLVAAAAFLYLDLSSQPEAGELQAFFRPGDHLAFRALSGPGTRSAGSPAEIGFSIHF